MDPSDTSQIATADFVEVAEDVVAPGLITAGYEMVATPSTIDTSSTTDTAKPNFKYKGNVLITSYRSADERKKARQAVIEKHFGKGVTIESLNDPGDKKEEYPSFRGYWDGVFSKATKLATEFQTKPPSPSHTSEDECQGLPSPPGASVSAPSTVSHALPQSVRYVFILQISTIIIQMIFILFLFRLSHLQ